MSSRTIRGRRWLSAVATVMLIASSGFGMGVTAAASTDLGALGAAPTNLTVGQLASPVDIENLTAPLLGWDVGGGMQSAYQVQVATTTDALSVVPDVWDSGQIASSENSNIAYAGPALTLSSGYYWRVRTWDAVGNPSGWSAPAHFGTGPGSTWTGATPIWTAAATGAWSDFTYTGTFSITGVAASVSFRTQNTSNFYLWQFRASNASTEPNMLKMHYFVAGTATVIQEVAEPFTVAASTTYQFKIVTAGSTITTYLKHTTDTDWTLANSLTDTTYASGGIGFRTGSTESAKFGSVLIQDPSGNTLYSNNFPSGNTDFSVCGSVSGGLLTVNTNKNCVYPNTNANWAFLRGNVSLQSGKSIAWAHLYATGSSTVPAKQYVYKMSVNGQFVGVGPTQPVVSTAPRYDGYDVTSLLNPGATNTIGALAYTTSGQQFDALLLVRYTDGTTDTFGTGSSWKALNGIFALPPSSSIGTSYYTAPQENFSAANYPFGFDTPGFNDSSWPAATLKANMTNLVATPTAKVQRHLETPVSVTEYSPGNYVIDYGRTWVGGMSLNITGTANQVIDIRYGEVLTDANTVKYQAAATEKYEDKWTLMAGPQHLESWGPKVFRYVNVLGAPTGLTAADLTAEAFIYPFDTSLSQFVSSDSNLNQVWQLSKNTIEAVNLNLYVDSWERERGAYEADDFLQLMSNLYTGGDSTLGTYSMQYLMANRTWPTEWPMYAIQAALNTYMQTGDTTPLTLNYTALQGKLPDKWYDSSTGLIHKTTGADGSNSATDDDIVDWPASDRDGFVFSSYDTVINSISYRSYVDMATIATALGHTSDAATYTTKANALYTSINNLMWDPVVGTYRDGLQNTTMAPIAHDAIQAGVFAVAFGLATPARAAQVASYISGRGMACSVYCAAFLIQAAYLGDRPDVASSLLASTGTNSWMNMIAQGAGATMEAWTTTEKSNLTYSHPWAASPAFNIPQGMFGINPTSPGYDTLDIKPQPGTISWGHITVPSVKGEIGAAFDTVDLRTDVGVWVPANSIARVLVPAVGGTTTIYEDGRSTLGTVTDGYFEVDNVQPGCHVFTTQAGNTAAAYSDTKLTGVCSSADQLAVDTTAPITTATVTPAAPSGTNVASYSVALSATDDVSGVASTSYTLDGGGTQTYAGPIDIPSGSTHTLTYWSTDNYSNAEAANSLSLRWSNTAFGVSLDATASAGTTPTIYIGGTTDPSRVREDGVLASSAPGVSYVGVTNNSVEYSVGSGTYHFSDTWGYNVSGSFTAGGVAQTGGTVYAFTGAGAYVGSSAVDGSGNYTFSLAPGTYKFYLAPVSPGYPMQWFGSTDGSFATATSVVVTGDTTQAIALAGVYTISGAFTAGGVPQAGGTVYIFNGAGGYVGSAVADGSGNYTFSYLPNGNYKLYVAPSSPGYATQWFGSTDGSFATATAVAVSGNTTADVALAGVYDLSGNFTAGGVPQAGGTVYAFTAGSYSYVGSAAVDGSGHYSFSYLPAGTYKLYLQPSSAGYGMQWFGGSDFASATTVALTAATVQNISLIGEYTLSGTFFAGGAPQTGGALYVFTAAGSYVGSASIDGSGHYSFGYLAAGSYKIYLAPVTAGYSLQWYGGSDFASATTFNLSAPSILNIAL